MTADGQPCIVAVPLGNRSVLVQVWLVRLGRVRLLPARHRPRRERAVGSRAVGAALRRRPRDPRPAGNRPRHRRRARAARRSAPQPTVWHLNEGHAAFVVLQRIRDLIEAGESFDAALDEVRRTTVFTTHTPVPAGHDAFPFNLVETASGGLLGHDGRVPRPVPGSSAPTTTASGPQFNMTALAMRTAGGVNAVSQLHGVVTREMLAPMWPGVEAQKRPVRAITNGVHMPTWLSNEMVKLFDDHLPGGLARSPRRSGALGARPRHSRRGAVGGARRRCATTSSRSCASAPASAGATTRSAPRASSPPARCSIPNALTIGFARRFTGYKRPELIFHDPARLAAHPQRGAAARADRVRRQGASRRRGRQTPPAAGLSPRHRSGIRRAHRVRRRLRPARGAFPGAGLRRLAEQSAQAARGQRHQRHEGLDQRRAAPLDRRRLVGRGLHRPERLADRRRRAADLEAQDAADAARIYDLLEREIVPTFYDLDGGIPRRWLSYRPPGDRHRRAALQRAGAWSRTTWTTCTRRRSSRRPAPAKATTPTH